MGMGMKAATGHAIAAMCRALPGAVGPGRLLERLRWRLGMIAYRLIGQAPAGAARVIAVRGGAHMQLALGEYVDRSIYCTGEWEPRESALIAKRLRPGDCMVDVGAYIGWFTLLGARIVGPSGTVIAFEANRATCARLEGNLARNGFANVTVCNVAVGDAAGRARIASRTAGNAGGDYVEFSRGAGGKDGVAAVRLDEILGDRPVRLLKIDIEGAEAKALRGAAALLARPDAPDIVLELTPDYIRAAGDDPAALVAQLRDCGYHLLDIQRGTPIDPRDDLAARPQTYLYCSKDKPGR